MSPKLAALFTRANAVGLALFAFFWIGAAFPGLDGTARFLLDLLDWRLDGAPAALDQYTRSLSAIGAGLTAAFAALSWFVVAPAIERGDRKARARRPHRDLHLVRRRQRRLDRLRRRFKRCLQHRILRALLAMAKKLAGGPTFANGITKNQLNMEWDMSLDTAIEAEAQEAIRMKTNDFKRAYDAFVAKEKPVFGGD